MQTSDQEGRKLVVEIDLGKLWAGEDGSVSEYIAGVAAKMLLKSEGEVRDAFRRRVRALTDDEISRQVEPFVREALALAVQKTDTFGTPIGQPRPVHAYVVETVREELKLRDGRRSGSGSQDPVLQRIIHEEVDRTLAAELRETVKEAKGEVLEAVRTKAAEILAETIAKIAEGRAV